MDVGKQLFLHFLCHKSQISTGRRNKLELLWLCFAENFFTSSCTWYTFKVHVNCQALHLP